MAAANRLSLLVAAIIIALVVLTSLAPTGSSISSGIHRSSFNDDGCSCHNLEADPGVTVTLAGLPVNYTSQQTYTLTVQITGGPPAGGSNQGGFNLVVSAGTLTVLDERSQLFDNGLEATHTTAGNDQRNWSLNWTAPIEGTNYVDFSLVANSVDGSGSNDAADGWNQFTLRLPVFGYTAPPPQADSEGFPFTLLFTALGLLVVGLLVAMTRFGPNGEPLIPPARALEVLKDYATTTDHKKIGTMYIITGLFFFIVAGMIALLMRYQLAQPDNDFLTGTDYNSAFTTHGTTMIFLAAMPLIFGFANYIVPLQLGARDLAFPRLNALSFWLLPTGALVIYWGLFVGGNADVGWTGYVPYSASDGATRPGTDLWVAGQFLLGASSTLTAVNFITTILRYRAPGVSMMRMPLFSWSILVSVVMLLFAMPPFTVALVLLYLDRNLGTLFFDTAAGGDPLLWEHLFWFFGHPEVYVVIIPAFGAISEIISTFARRPIFGYRSMVYAMGGIAFISFLVWGHHLFTSGSSPSFRFLSMVATMAVAVPTGIKIFNWLATLDKGSLVLKTPMIFALGCIATFTMGGITGVWLASIPIDTHLHDSFFVVGHFHYTLIGGVVFGFFAAIYYWYPKMTGRLLDERLGLLHFLITFLAFHMTYYPMHELGVLGMPRRISTYSNEEWAMLNQMSTTGAFIFLSCQLLLVFNMLRSYRSGQVAGDDPWGGWSLEWTTTSPPPEHSFERLPTLKVTQDIDGTQDPPGSARPSREEVP